MQAKKATTAAIPCPICDGKLRGNYQAGYKCSRCFAHFTGSHTVWLTKNHLRTQIDAHFGEKKEIQETRVVVEESQTSDNQPDHAVITLNPQEEKLSIMISETHEAANKSTQHLEDILQIQEEVQEKIEKTKAKLEPKVAPIPSKKIMTQSKNTPKKIVPKKTTRLLVKPILTRIRIIKPSTKNLKSKKPSKQTNSRQLETKLTKSKLTKTKLSSKSRTTKKKVAKKTIIKKKVSKKKKF